MEDRIAQCTYIYSSPCVNVYRYIKQHEIQYTEVLFTKQKKNEGKLKQAHLRMNTDI